MSHTPVGGHPQGWEHKLADRSSLPPAPGEERGKSHSKHVFTYPQLPNRGGGASPGSWSPVCRTSPPFVRWARSLHALLEDAEGVRLFRKYVLAAGGLHVDRLNFYFAVQGLRQETDMHKANKVVAAIYKFLRKSQLTIPEELKYQLKQGLKDGTNFDKNIFDAMEQEVSVAITESTYASFLRSEAYVSYVSANTQPLSSPDDPAPPPQPHPPLPPPPPVYPIKEMCGLSLATVHEGQELSAAPARLTHDALLATQTRRLHTDLAPSSFGGGRSVYSAAHLAYGGYCPASRQDSERASLSSGRTDSDAVSLSEASLEGGSMRVRESRPRRLPGMDRHAVINRDHDTAMVIPRTQRIQSEQLRVPSPAEFASILIEKLERVRRDQDAKERLDRRLNEGDGEDASTQALPPQLVAAAIREKLQVDDDNDQDILDQHVSRVWSELTPASSPPRNRRRPASSASADSGLVLDRHTARSGRSFCSRAGGTGPSLPDSGVSVVSADTGLGSEPRRPRPLSNDRDEHRRKHKRGGGSKSSGSSESTTTTNTATTTGSTSTVVVVTFLDEAVPYRLKVPAAPLTLRTFKDYLPRKGHYRYFFKTECADLDNTVIQEEICSDSEILPMFEGKVMARVKSIE